MHIQKINPIPGGGFNAAVFDSAGRVIHAAIEGRRVDAEDWLATTVQLIRIHPSLHAPSARERYALAGYDERRH